jgi:hypothetical protein
VRRATKKAAENQGLIGQADKIGILVPSILHMVVQGGMFEVIGS